MGDVNASGTTVIKKWNLGLPGNAHSLVKYPAVPIALPRFLRTRRRRQRLRIFLDQREILVNYVFLALQSSWPESLPPKYHQSSALYQAIKI